MTSTFVTGRAVCQVDGSVSVGC